MEIRIEIFLSTYSINPCLDCKTLGVKNEATYIIVHMVNANKKRPQDTLQLFEFSFECNAIAAFWITSQGDISRVNRAACDFLHYDRDELETLSIFDIDPSASPLTWSKHWAKLKTNKSMTFQSRHRTKQGELRPVEITINFFQLGQTEYNFAFAKDLSAQQQAEDALQETRERHALVVQAANDGIWDWDLQTQELYCSERWFAMLGLPPRSIQSLEAWMRLIHAQDRGAVIQAFQAYQQQRSTSLAVEFRICHGTGQYRWMSCQGKALKDFNGDIIRIAGSITDVTEQKEAQQRLLYEANHDLLTGLPNRKFFLECLDALTLKSQAFSQKQCAVLFLDVDRFKLVNDSLGHQAGDELLRTIAIRLRLLVSDDDWVARVGGDEFLILLSNLPSTAAAIHLAQRVLDDLNRPVSIQGQHLYPKVSIGIAMGVPGVQSSEDFIQQADIAMVEAKASSSSQYAVFHEGMQAIALRRLQLESDMKAAIQNQEFKVVYQPIVDIETQAVLGFESLLRWSRQTVLIPPDVFIPIAEDTGMILDLGWFVLQEACQQMADWQGMQGVNPDLFVTINISSQQLMQPDFVQQVQDVIESTDVNPCQIKLEMTESIIINNKDFACEQIKALQSMGLKICMDDFGTGYSSLGMLHQLPIDCVKIDKSFVQEIQTTKDQPEIVKVIVAIADSLNLNVIAEGVETFYQAMRLREIGCSKAQGFYFNYPLSKSDATTLIQSCPRLKPRHFENVTTDTLSLVS